ncbi:hypothetical protein AB0B40_00105 [Streptomyces sp. NPDC042638]|uniref:hypothetical protein n=1 Tax=Streptomyces sp. NPDC042638 TaxID=3154333 RepID=UPI00340A48A4
MYTPARKRALRFTAVLTLVVLCLTGFSKGRHHRGGGSGGGGCSSSHQDHDSSTSTSGGGSYDSSGGSAYGSGDGYGSGTGGGSYRRTHRPTSTPSGSGGHTSRREGAARLISCASAGKPYATVEVTNPNDRKAAFTVEVLFLPDSPPAIDSGRVRVSVPARGTKTVDVPFSKRADIDLLDHCEVDERVPLAN